eukprot:gnl/MRDRNA2_/MRDRNA2_85407_c0_seq1.p1 gnl/MRDRNA2_/MRDRNA2_85407_c0~~gnl/MRDRNA2_/MRDRNA2_85407_c0_seq1.p1  ORF type:complete len:101 (+),score=2.09 gnl/MRDRNA2_/MRDRNA2_85407_c0_seq1:290-592(+)
MSINFKFGEDFAKHFNSRTPCFVQCGLEVVNCFLGKTLSSRTGGESYSSRRTGLHPTVAHQFNTVDAHFRFQGGNRVFRKRFDCDAMPRVRLGGRCSGSC